VLEVSARAAVSFERLYNYVVMSGQIRSGQFLYTFRTELVGYLGFALTSNPFGPVMPTPYYFKRN
jgi:hypothetical protein